MARPAWCNLLVGLLLLVSLAEFTVRGPIRAFQSMGWNDFLSPYIQAKAWAGGHDPYSARVLVSLWPFDNKRPVWVDREAANGTLEFKRGMPTPYPIPSFVVIAPFTVFSWRLALSLWIVICAAAVALSPIALLSICGCRLFDLRSQLFLAAAFALAPFHTGLATANPAMLAVSLTVATVWFSQRGWQKTAGIVLAIAVCLKPTVAAGLLLYYLIRRRKIASITLAATAGISIVGVSRMMLAGVPWLSSYLENTHRIFAPGSLADFARSDAIRFNMINLQVLLYSLLKNPLLANLLSWLFAIALGGWWLLIIFRSRQSSGMMYEQPHEQGAELINVGPIFVLTLICVYHRFYDAALLIWPLAWGILLVRKRSAMLATLLPMAPFLVSGPPLLAQLASDGSISTFVAHSWYWNAIVLPHEVGALLCLAIALLYFAAQIEDEVKQKPMPAAPAIPPRKVKVVPAA